MTVIETVKMLGGGDFAKTPEDEITKWIELCEPMVSKKLFGKLYNQALAYLVCHKMKMAGLGENTMGDLGKVTNAYSVSSISDGGSSISFAAAGAGNLQADAEYTMTSYGAQFLQLRRMAIIPVRISGEDSFYGGL